jgi:hypothetical protein
MQTTTATPETTATQAVVSQDTPAINLANLAFPTKVLVAEQSMPQLLANPLAHLKALEADRISWEGTELAASNRRLYSILKQAYSYYLTLKNDENKDTRMSLSSALALFIAERGYTFLPSTHDMSRVIKCVFGVDRRRVSAYSIALREALRQEISINDLTDFIEQNGGVEQIRLGGTKPLSATKRAERVKDEVFSKSMGKFKFDPLLVNADAEWNDKQVVIIATYLPTGEFEANTVIKNDGAVTAALAAYYSNQQAAIRAQAKAEKEAKAEAEAQEKAALAEEQKQKEMEEQIAKTKAAQAQAVIDAQNLAIVNSLVEGALI